MPLNQNLAVPTNPTPIPTININGFTAPQLLAGTQIPRVHGTEEAQKYPSTRSSESVLYDATEDDIVYFRMTDENGYTTVRRCRCYEEPEKTPDQLNEEKFLTKQEFQVFAQNFKEEIGNVQQRILSALESNQSYKPAGGRPYKPYNKNRQSGESGESSQGDAQGA